MIQRLSLPVSVKLFFDHRTRTVMPAQVTFDGRDYPVVKLGFHHLYRRGRTLYHVFSVSSPTLFFRLVLDTDTLHWTLEEISDGEVG